MSRYMDTSSTNGENYGQTSKIPCFFERNLQCHPLAGFLLQLGSEKTAEKPHAETVSSSYDMKRHANTCVISLLSNRLLHLASIGGLDILWSVNKLARADTKWTRACDRPSARFISYFHLTQSRLTESTCKNQLADLLLEGSFTRDVSCGNCERSWETACGTLSKKKKNSAKPKTCFKC